MRITLLIIAGFLLFAGAGTFWLMRTVRKNVERQYSQAAEEPMVDFAHLLASIVETDLGPSGEIDAGRFRGAFAAAYERKFEAKIYDLHKTAIATHVYVTGRDGVVLYDSDGGRREGQDFSEYNDILLTLRGKYGVRASRRDPEDSRSTIFFVAAPIRWRGEVVGVLTVSRPEEAMAPFAEGSRAAVLRWSIAAGAVIATLGAAWTYWLLSPIGRLTRHARAVRMGGRAVVPELGHAELRTLSRALEAMRRELEGLDYVENYVQALTHELKSPLAGIRGAAELLDEDMPDDKRARFLENIRAETGRCEDLVRRLVQLAALESRTAPDRIEKLDFAALVRDEIATLRPRLEAKTLRLTEEFSAETDDAGTSKWIAGDPLTLQIAVRNLLTNAIDFSPDGGEIRVLLGRGEEDGGVELRIEDEGPGVPDYAAERIFDRFYSLKHSVTGRKGSGLGLCFVRQAMLLHGGDIRLENRGSGAGGTRAVMRLGS